IRTLALVSASSQDTLTRRLSLFRLHLLFHQQAPWHAPSKPNTNPQEEKLHRRGLQQRLPASPPLSPVVSRSLIATVPALSLFVRFVAIKSRPIPSSAGFLSNALSARLPRTLRATCISRLLRCLRVRRRRKPTMLGCLKTATCVPSIASVSQSCPRTCNFLGASVARQQSRGVLQSLLHNKVRDHRGGLDE
ncbi:hypothetical protein ACHAXN_001713, partial [Cyclotella atomus]